jgi:uncharacterized membrane protein YfcA
LQELSHKYFPLFYIFNRSFYCFVYQKESDMKSIRSIGFKPLLTVLCGLGAGIINGLLGAGSGILLAYTLRALSPALRDDSRDLMANATAIILPISLVSVFFYLRAGTLPPPAQLSPFLLPGIVGGLFGALLLDKLSGTAVKRLFGSVVLVSGLIMLLQ